MSRDQIGPGSYRDKLGKAHRNTQCELQEVLVRKVSDDVAKVAGFWSAKLRSCFQSSSPNENVVSRKIERGVFGRCR